MTPAALVASVVVAVVLAAAIGAAVAMLMMRRSKTPQRSGQRAGGAATNADGGGDPDHESFGYIVSHDLRAPIRVVEGFTKIVKEDYGDVLDKVGHDHLDRVLGAATRIT